MHCDIAGPFPTVTPHGKKYMIICLEDSENHLRLDLLATRDQALVSFKITHKRWENQFGCKILAIQIDNAGKLLSEEFTGYLNEHRITRRLSVPYQHQQNGKAERCIQTLEGHILAMLNGAGAAPNLWGEAALCAGYLWQYTPSSTLPCGVTPFELASKSKPDLSHLRVWGSRCFT